MLNVGLTGGIASGKSTVVQLLADRGALIIDFDLLTRYVEEPGRPAWNKIASIFGKEIIKDDGTINRRKLGEIVFQNPEKLARLNAIVHPLVFQEWKRRLTLLQENQGNEITISDIPLLIETNAQQHFDVIILVYCPPWLQIQRLMIRNGYNAVQAQLRLDSQYPIDLKVPYADIIIDNGLNLEKTIQQVDAVWKELNARNG